MDSNKFVENSELYERKNFKAYMDNLNKNYENQNNQNIMVETTLPVIRSSVIETTLPVIRSSVQNDSFTSVKEDN